MKKTALTIIWLLVIVALISYLWRHAEEIARMLSLSASDILSLAGLFIITQYLNGLRLGRLLRKADIKLDKKECFHLSNINTMANYIPFKGGTVATAVYFKSKHNISYTTFTNVGIVSQIFQLFAIGLVSSFLLVINYFMAGVFLYDLFCFFMVLLLSAITAIFVLRALAGARLVSNSRFTKIREIAHGSHSILKDNKLFMDLLTINLLSIAVMALRFIVAFRAINYKASFILSFTAAQAKTLAIFLNLTPSGIGIAEFSAGVVSRLTDKNLNVGVYAASIDRVVSIVTLLAISLFSAVYFYRYKIRPKGRS